MDNTTLFFAIYNLRGQLPWLDLAAIHSTNNLLYLSPVLVALLALRGGSREKKAAILAFVGLILAPVIIFVIRLFFQELRPFSTYQLLPLIPPPTDLSFPSGHATRMAVITFSYLFTHSRWFWLFLILTLWISFTRIYIGVHYPLDILGGWITGLVIIIVLWIIKNYLWKKYFAI